MNLDQNALPTVLEALGAQYAERSDQNLAIVVCGGSALAALGLVIRTTRDVDVLAIARVAKGGGDPELTTAEPLPMALVEAAQAVGSDFHLPAGWLNAGPTDLLTEGLPVGCPSRLHTFKFGDRLTIYFIDRFDQICLKTYAAINGDAA